MTAIAIQNPLPTFTGLDGLPLSGGYVYFGEENKDPRSFPIAIFYDDALTAPASQPLRTTAGYLSNNGAPSGLWAAVDFSVLVLDSKLQQVFYAPTVEGFSSANTAFVQSGVGAVVRDVQAKVRETVSVTDFGTATQAASATAGTVVVPNGVTPTLPAAYPGVLFDYLGPSVGINEFQEAGETTRKSARVFRGYDAGAHTGQEHTLFTVESHVVGSGTNGPTNADYGMTIVAQKKNFDTTTIVGEIDGLNIALRQGGAASDGCAILSNVATYGTGFVGTLESVTSIIAAGGAITKQVGIQIGICDNVSPNYMGYFAKANVGALNSAYQADSLPGASWGNLFLGTVNGVEIFSISGTGNVNLSDSSGNKKTLRCITNTFSILNSAGAVEILSLTDAGALTVPKLASGTAALTGGATSVASGINLGGTTAATATAGAATLPANPVGFLIFFEGATQRKIPYYNT